MRRAYARIDGHSEVIAAPYGSLEYATGGAAGPPVLVIHGSGGGFDQGVLLAQALLGPGFRWIAPSRFGYLRSSLPAGATFDTQADAYAFLLDHLGRERVAVVAISHGGPSALLFAVRHPERITSLTLLSAGVASSADASQVQANQQGDALRRIFQQDWRYWVMTRLFRGPFLELMGASGAVYGTLTAEQRQLADRILDEMNPVSRRAAGVTFDNRAALPNERIAAIRTRTLIVHATDDTLQRYANAEYAAATIPGARLLTFPRGGHLVVAVELAAIRAAVRQNITAGP
jgi:pimeloyl-ACP methyl ester carboxylesterase